jgi:signal peptidase I
MQESAQGGLLEPQTYSISGSDLAALMEAVLAKDGTFRFTASGSSMAPFIQTGDMVTISPLRKGRVGLGTVVAFKHPVGGHLVIHRVVGVAHGTFLIKGDNTPHRSDGWIPSGCLIGRVLEITRDGRRVWLGLGVERYLIAFFSRWQWLIPLRGALAALRRR